MPVPIARPRALARTLATALPLLVLLVLAAPAGATTALQRVGTAPALPSGASLVGTLAASARLHVTVALQPRDPAALAGFAAAVADPASAAYRGYLTPAEFAQRFGATPTAVAAVERALRARGLTPGPIAADRLSIPVTATASTLSQAFSTVLERIREPDGSAAVINSLAPDLGAATAPLVQAVVGLDSLGQEHPLRAPETTRAGSPPAAGRHGQLAPHVVTGGPQPCSAATSAAGPQSAYTADQIASAYDFSGLFRAGDEGAGVTVGIYELEPYDPKDIAQYQSCYGTSAAVTNVSVDGGNGAGAGSGEAALDVEQVIGLAPKANIVVYNGPNSQSDGPGAGPFDLFATIVNQDTAKVVTNSWGQCEPEVGSADAHAEETLFEQAAAQGQTILSAAGDEGSADCDAGGLLANTSLAVDDPGSDPFVTSVGGSSLTGLGPPPAETTWNNGGGGLGSTLGIAPGAGGGGVSSFWAMPAYQLGAAASLGVIGTGSSGTVCGAGTSACREVPDVSASADPEHGYLIYYNGSGTVGGNTVGWQGTGGTSAAAPLWAALVADADSSAQCAGSPIGFLNPALYRAAGASYGADFHDITTGDNDYIGTHHGLYPAEAGYDMATGLGTPSAATLAASLCADSLRVGNPGTITSSQRAAVSYQLPVHIPSGASVSLSETGLPAGLKLNPSTGVVTGTPTSVGRSTVRIVASDTGGGVQSDVFTWVISAAPKLSGASLKGVAARRPVLALGVRGGVAFTKLAVTMPKGISVSGKVRGLTVTGPGNKKLAVKASAAHGVLTVTLAAPSSQLKLSLRAPGISASGALVRQVAGGRRPSLALRVRASDATGQSALSGSVRASQ